MLKYSHILHFADLDCLKVKVRVSSWQKFITYYSNIRVNKISMDMGSCCGSIDITVTSDTRGLWFESSHWQIFK